MTDRQPRHSVPSTSSPRPSWDCIKKSSVIVDHMGEETAFSDWAAIQTTANLLMQKDRHVTNPQFYFRMMWVLLLLVACINTGISCFFADVVAKVGEWSNSDWQGCLVYHNDHFIHNEVTAHLDKRLNFAIAMLGRGPNSNMFTVAGFVVTFVSLGPLNMFDLLPTAIVTTTGCCIASVAFMNLGAAIPSAKTLQATLITLSQFVNRDMYSHLEDSRAANITHTVNSVDCTKAYQINRVALWFNSVVIAILAIFFVMCVLAELRRQKYIRALIQERAQRGYPELPRLKGSKLLFLSFVTAWVAWITTLCAKQEMALRVMHGIQNMDITNPKIAQIAAMSDPLTDVFPFPSGQMDINSLLLVGMSVLASFGLSHREPILCYPISMMCIIFISLFYPNMTLAWETIATNNLGKPSECRKYFQTPQYGDPSDSLADIYCTDTWASFIATLSVLVCVHVILAVCCYMISYNQTETADDVFHNSVLTVPMLHEVISDPHSSAALDAGVIFRRAHEQRRRQDSDAAKIVVNENPVLEAAVAEVPDPLGDFGELSSSVNAGEEPLLARTGEEF